MAFERPTLGQLIKRAEGDFKSGLGLITVLRRSFIGVTARVIAGFAHSHFGYLKFIEKNVFGDTAEGEYLIRLAKIFGVEQKNATFAEFTASVTGTAGVVIPANRVYRRSDGQEYTTQAEVILTGSGDEISLLASVAGTAPNVAVSDVISILSPIANLTPEATVTSIEIQGEDIEDLELLRGRFLDRVRNPPSGGTANDYIQWAKEVAGITRAWVKPLADGPGTVTVFIVSDTSDPITPSAPKVAEAQAYVDLQRPTTANVTVVAPVLFPIDMVIALSPNLTDVQTAIEAELRDLITRDAQVTGTYSGPGTTYNGKILLSRINEAISIGAGEEDHEIISINGDTTPGNVEPPDGNLAVLGDITWQVL